MIFLYRTFAFRVTSFASVAFKPKQVSRFLRKDLVKIAHKAMGIPIYFIFGLLSTPRWLLS